MRMSAAWSERRVTAGSGPVYVGDYRTVFDDVESSPKRWGGTQWDTLITDPPFGPRTHDGARTSAKHGKHGVAYDHWIPSIVHEFVMWAVPRTRRWIAAMTSHDLCVAWEIAYRAAGWYPFAPIPIIVRGMGVRRQGDGPASQAYYLMVARSRSREAMANPVSNGTALWRSLPGFYDVTRGSKRKRDPKLTTGRDKPIELLRQIVRDYSNPGDLVCDPLAGFGSTLIAALAQERHTIGSEIVPRVAKIANREIAEAEAKRRSWESDISEAM